MNDASRSRAPQPGCPHDNPADHRFCDACGATLSARCPRCRQINRDGAQYCAHCGAGLAQSAGRAAARIADPEIDGDEDDAPERLERLLEHRARLDRERGGRLGLIATVMVSLGVVVVALTSYWVGTRRVTPAGPPTTARSALAPSESADVAPADSADVAPREPAEPPTQPSPAERQEPESSPPPEPVRSSGESGARESTVTAVPGGGRAPSATRDASTTRARAGRVLPGAPPAARSSVEAMAAYLVESVGGAGAEARALQNAEWYDRGSSDHAYWMRVATAIRQARSAATR